MRKCAFIAAIIYAELMKDCNNWRIGVDYFSYNLYPFTLAPVFILFLCFYSASVNQTSLQALEAELNAEL